MNNLIKNAIALSLLIIAVIFLIAASNSTSAPVVDDCFHCGSVSACLSGGQPYGYYGCEYDPDSDPPDNCIVFAYGCGGEVGEN